MRHRLIIPLRHFQTLLRQLAESQSPMVRCIVGTNHLKAETHYLARRIAAVTLAKLGVGQLTLIDPDAVEPHNVADMDGVCDADVGRLKVETLADYLRAHCAERIRHSRWVRLEYDPTGNLTVDTLERNEAQAGQSCPLCVKSGLADSLTVTFVCAI
jgi:hypothetical protein